MTTSLWVGEIEHWADESYLSKCFEQFSEFIVNIKIIRDKMTGLPAGYGFVEFNSPEKAKHVLEACNGQPIPGLPFTEYFHRIVSPMFFRITLFFVQESREKITGSTGAKGGGLCHQVMGVLFVAIETVPCNHATFLNAGGGSVGSFSVFVGDLAGECTDANLEVNSCRLGFLPCLDFMLFDTGALSRFVWRCSFQRTSSYGPSQNEVKRIWVCPFY